MQRRGKLTRCGVTGQLVVGVGRADDCESECKCNENSCRVLEAEFIAADSEVVVFDSAFV
jgi:hypothetical protein